jgi:hypothetical protein
MSVPHRTRTPICATGYRIPHLHWTPYVVSACGLNHNSPVEWAEEGLPRGLQSSKEKAKVQAKVWNEV